MQTSPTPVNPDTSTEPSGVPTSSSEPILEPPPEEHVKENTPVDVPNPAKSFQKPPMAPIPFSVKREMEMSKKKMEKAKKEQERAMKERERRMAELKKRGVSEEHLEMVMAQEDYRGMPVNERLQRLEAMVSRGFQSMANEIQALRHNDYEIATSMDINLKAIGKALTKLGIDPEMQMAIIQESQAEIAADEAAKITAKEAQVAAAAAQKAAESVAVAGVAEKRDLVQDIDKPGAPEAAPDGDATVFGG